MNQTSGLSAFFQQTGWPESVSKDTGPMFEVEKELADSYPIRKVVPPLSSESAVQSMLIVTLAD